jgi:putative ABC transport system ATP-binding protein
MSLISSAQEAPVLRLHAVRSARLQPVTLDLRAGEVIGIVGQSGSGKSLLLRQIADLDPGEGTVSLDGKDRSTMKGFEWRRQVMYCQAEAGWWEEQVAPHFAQLNVAQEIASRLGIAEDKFQAQVASLSTGERQRLALVRALALAPRVLLLDEPTAALDEEATLLVEAELKRYLSTGGSIVLVTHNLGQAGRFSQRLFRMSAGTLEPL